VPELPEVETIRRELSAVLVGRSFERVEIRDGRLTAPLDPEAVAHDLLGRTVASVGRRGKFLCLFLEGGGALVCHLRMTGWFRHVPAPHERPHLRARFGLDDGSWLLYSDQRRFGTMRLLTDDVLELYWAGRVGPEPLDPAWTPAQLRRSLRGRHAPIKAVLLDQRVVAGVGNIYADEALWEARVHPLTEAGSLSAARVGRLHGAVVEALRRGIEAQGASIDTYRRVDGQPGSMQERFAVYQRAGEPCLRCGRPIVKIRVAQRGTHLCARCTRLR
jgi:formamidopyrimidine-DNA glycosylase